MLMLGSRYTRTPVTYSPTKQSLFFRTRERVQFNKKDIIQHTIVQGDNLPMLAKKYYNNSSYYWVIMDANTNLQSEFDLVAGETLIVPSYTQVVRLIERG